MGLWDSIGSIFGNSDGKGAFGNILGGLATGATIYNAFNANQRAEDANALNQSLAQQKLDEEKRQFDLTYALKQAQGGGGGGGDGGAAAALAAQMAAKKADLIRAAYENLGKVHLEGRTAEANQLNNLLSGINQVLLSRPQGVTVR